MVAYIPKRYEKKIEKVEWPEPSKFEEECQSRILFYLRDKGIESVENKLKDKIVTLVHFKLGKNFWKDESKEGWTWTPTYAELALIFHQLYVAEKCNEKIRQ